MFRVFFREISACCATPAPYAISGVFLCISGLFFFHETASVSILASRIAQTGISGGISMNELLLRPFFSDLSTLVIFLCPLVSMGLFSGETAPAPPVSCVKILSGRYLAALVILTVMISLSALLMAVLAFFASPDWGIVVSSYLGLVLLGGAVLSMAAFASSLTRRQASAAAFTMGTALIFWMTGWFAPLFPEGRAGAVLQELSLSCHLSRFFEGTISLRDIAFYLELTVFFLALALTAMGRSRQRV